jgi:CRP-like cAMP-binding protein
MAIDALVKPLLGVELFRGLRPLQITEISRRAFRTVYKPGETIIEANVQGDAAVLIVSGQAVRVAGPGAAVGQPLPEGTLLGEMAMLIETEHSSTVVAKTPVRALRISRAEMHEQMADDCALADHFIHRIADRLKSIADELRVIDGVLDPEHADPVAARGSAARAERSGAGSSPPATAVH